MMNNRPIIIFDLDGTLALIDHRRHLVECKNPDWDEFYKQCINDTPNTPVIVAYNTFRNKDYFITANPFFDVQIWSGRSDIVRSETDKWLRDKVHERAFVTKMRKEGDFTPDDELKMKWMLEVGAKNILFVFDDRDKVVKMWRDNGIPCFQVAEGNF
jgi:hypothetical protein